MPNNDKTKPTRKVRGQADAAQSLVRVTVNGVDLDALQEVAESNSKRFGKKIDSFLDRQTSAHWWVIVQGKGEPIIRALRFSPPTGRSLPIVTAAPSKRPFKIISPLVLPDKVLDGEQWGTYDDFRKAHAELYSATVAKERQDRLPETDPVVGLERVAAELRAFRDSRIQSLQSVLNSLEGWTTADVDRKVELADLIQATADDVRRVFECTKCGEPGRFRCIHGPRNAAGGFVFVHKNTKKHGGTIAIPKLKLVESNYTWKKS